MKLIIDIPDRIHYAIELGITVNGSDASQMLIDAVKNGTPLPKGHGRLIDADELELDYDWSEYETDTGQLIVNGYQAYSSTQVESAPIIIEADREDK